MESEPFREGVSEIMARLKAEGTYYYVDYDKSAPDALQVATAYS